MNIQQNISLKEYNTFGIDVDAKRFISVTSLKDLKQVIKSEQNIFLISGGSNILLTKNIEQLVVHLNLTGISVDNENENFAHITVSAGENWHNFVLWCISRGYGGIENLSLIPGNVGTCPIQNIGAYGVEVKDVITHVHTIEKATGKEVVFTAEQCEFGYRNSIFKNRAKDKYIVIAVRFKLTKNNHKLTTSYGAIETLLKERNINTPSITDISDAVIHIRKSKLPDPKKIGNSGSFFKNPIITINHFNQLQKKHPNIPSYKVSDTEIKVPAGWLIEKCGFKGMKIGNCGVHEKQALVLVNYGNSSGKEIYELALKIKNTVHQQFSINLEMEVNII